MGMTPMWQSTFWTITADCLSEPHTKLSSPGGQELFFQYEFPMCLAYAGGSTDVYYINKYIALAVRKKNEQTRDIDRKY